MLSLFAVGLISILAQVIVLRELSVAFYGVELIYVLAIGGWMLCSAAGALAGRVAGQGGGGGRRLRAGFALMALALPLDVFLARSVRLLFAEVPGAFLPFERQLAAMALVLFPAAFLSGLLFRWAAGEAVARGSTLGRAYAVESLGGVFGGLLATALLVAGAANLPSAIAAALLSAAAAQIDASGARFRPNIGAALIGAILLAALPGSSALDFASTAWTHPNLAATRDSPYGRITVERQGGEVSVFENDALSFNSEGTEAEEFVHLAALQHPAPESVLVLGGGVEGLLAEVLLHRPRRVEDVELNPAVARVVRPLVPSRLREAARDPAVTVLHEDPREYVRRAAGSYDLILVGMPEPSSGQANRFYTVEFFLRCRALMNPGGVLALRVASAENAWTPQMTQRTGSIYRALKEAFRDVLAIPGTTCVLAGSTGGLCRDPEILAARLAARGFVPRLVSAPYLRYVFTNDRFGEIAGLLERSRVPVNSDARPVCYRYTAMIWLSKFFPSLAVAGAEDLPAGSRTALWFALAAAVAAILAGARRPGTRRVLLAGTAGFAGTVLEIVLILHYQVTSGVLYQNLGVLLMSFMGGLAAGAAAVEARERPRIGWPLLLPLIALLPAGGIAWELGAGVEMGLAVTSLELAAAGFLVAAAFAHAGRIRAEERRGLIAPLYAADLAGGCIGTVAGSLLMVPALGLTATALWMVPAALLIGVLAREGRSGALE